MEGMSVQRTALVTGANKGIGLETARHRGTQTIEEGAGASVRLALLDDAGPTGGFFDARGPVPW